MDCAFCFYAPWRGEARTSVFARFIIIKKEAAQVLGPVLFYWATQGSAMQGKDSDITGQQLIKKSKKRVAKKLARRSTKRRGELAEVAFMYKAASLGFGVAKPYGDSDQYDFILDSGQQLWRVQVKSTHAKGNGKWKSYQVLACHSSNHGKGGAYYTPEEIDFLVSWIAVRDVWYVVPVRAFTPRKSLTVYPEQENGRGRFEAFREAWCQMACARERLPIREGLEVERKCEMTEHSEKVLKKIGGCPLRKREADTKIKQGLHPGK